MRNARTRLGLLAAAAGLIGMTACSSEPTSQSTNAPPLSVTQVLSVSGPPYATTTLSKSYTYQAYMGASYPTFLPWGVRSCPTSITVAGCTTAWISVTGTTSQTYYNTITRSFAGSCANLPKGGSYQVRAQASAFGVPTQTAYFVTRLCPNN